MNHDKIISMMKHAIDMLAYQSKYDDVASMKAHIVGLQGEKRIDRIEDRKYHMTAQYLQHKLWDKFDVEYYPIEKPVNLSMVTSIDSYFSTHIAALWEFYMSLNALGNEMVAAGYNSYSDCLSCHAKEVDETIDRLQRLSDEYTMSGKSYIHISRYETTNCNVHDEGEEKEKAQGYKY